MLTNPKIKYHYDFPHLPITDNDIQLLNNRMNDIVDRAQRQIGKHFHKEMQMADIFISDAVVTKTYGKYNYKAILKEARKFYEAFPYSYFNDVLEHLVHILKETQADTPFGVLKELIDCMESKLNHAELEEERTKIQKIINMLKNTKRTTTLLGAYYSSKNRIVLYINTIARHFDKAPCGSLTEKILTGLDIVLAHEVFHAIQFHLMDTGYYDGKRFWTYPNDAKDYRDSILEGLARWFEYSWCYQEQFTNATYNWHKEQIEKELDTHYYPGWPYAAAKVFVQNGKPLYQEPMMVLDTLLDSVSRRSKHCWRNAYEVLELLDHSNKSLQQNTPIQNSNTSPKMIFLRP